MIAKFILELHPTFSLKDLGGLNFFLGIDIQQTASDITLSQEGYIFDVLCRYTMQDAGCKADLHTNRPVFQT
ncbi:hypothetical protein V2J09_005233 [Rumex salicifolius]